MGMFINELHQSITVHGEQLRIFTGQRGSSAGAAVKKRELSNHVSRLVFRKDKFLAVRAFHEKLNAAGAKDKNLAARIAVMKNYFARFELAAVHHLGQRFTLLVIKKPKDGNFSNHGHGCRHWGLYLYLFSLSLRSNRWSSFVNISLSCPASCSSACTASLLYLKKAIAAPKNVGASFKY